MKKFVKATILFSDGTKIILTPESWNKLLSYIQELAPLIINLLSQKHPPETACDALVNFIAKITEDPKNAKTHKADSSSVS